MQPLAMDCHVFELNVKEFDSAHKPSYTHSDSLYKYSMLMPLRFYIFPIWLF